MSIQTVFSKVWTRRVVCAGLALLIMPAFSPTGPALAKSPRAVVELFTSQGCSSCPPADAFLGDLAKRDDVIALTLAVDYWDYLGWKDTFASPAHSKRQAAYAKRRGDGQVYTPQMVLNGRRHAIGSHRSEVLKVLAQETDFGSKSWVPVTLKSNNKAIMVSAGAYKGQGKAPDATIWLLLSTKKEKVAIQRGENRGREVSYHNVVRQMVPIGAWHGEAVSVELPASDLMAGYDGCTAILQVNGAGAIIGAAYFDSTDTAQN